VFICLLTFSASLAKAQQIFVCNQAAISFFSSAPVEDIKANTNKGFFAYNAQSKEVYFKVPVNTFQFRKSLMQRHFNDTYLETDKYPYAEFKGHIIQDIDPAGKGAHQVDVQGNLTLHGVTKPYKVSGTLTIDDRGVTATAAFVVQLVDHHIEIPKLLFKNIAESVEVKVNATAVAK
jgi:polyisoprenoid-binding protein YceI